jgi:hypothetical protein
MTFLYPRRIRCKAVEHPQVPAPTIRIDAFKFAAGMVSVAIQFLSFGRLAVPLVVREIVGNTYQDISVF